MTVSPVSRRQREVRCRLAFATTAPSKSVAPSASCASPASATATASGSSLPPSSASVSQPLASATGSHLVETIEELDVSRRRAARAKRHGLRRAVEMVEAGDADVLVVAYFDRLVRSLAVQEEVVERVEQAGGAILAVDVGEVRADTRRPAGSRRRCSARSPSTIAA